MAKEISYWRHVHRQAWREATMALHIESRERFVLAVIAAVLTIAGLLFWGSEGSAKDEIISIGFGKGILIGAIIIAFPAVYLSRLGSIPPRQNKDQKEKINELEEELKSKISLEFEPQDRDCVHSLKLGDRNATIYRVRVRHLGVGTIFCSGYLTEVYAVGDPAKYQRNPAGSVRLTFAPGEHDDALKKPVSDGVPQYLDIGFAIEGEDRFALATKFNSQIKVREIPTVIKDLFKFDGLYWLKIVVESEHTKSKSCFLKLNNTFDWHQTGIICLEENI